MKSNRPKSLKPTRDGCSNSAVAVHVAVGRWLYVSLLDHIMNIRHSFIAATLTAAFVVGCTTRHAVDQRSVDPRIAALRCEAAWPVVEAAVRSEVARSEGSNSPLSSAYCNPMLHTNGCWAVVVSVAYPDFRIADHIAILVSDSGQIAAYGRTHGYSHR